MTKDGRLWWAALALAAAMGCEGATPATDAGGADTPDAAPDLPPPDAAPDLPPPDTAAPPDVDASTGEMFTSEFLDDLAVAGGFVYYANASAVRRVPVAGGATTTVYTATASAATSVDADATGVAWTERFASTIQGAVRSCPHAGCPAAPMAYNGAESSNRVALSANRVAWTSATAATVLVRDRATGRGGWSYRATMSMQYTPSDVAFDGDDIFWTTAGISVPGGAGTPGMVLRCSAAADACAPTVLASGAMIGHPDRVAVAPGAVFFLSDVGLFRVGRDGAGLTRLASVTTGIGANTFDLATDGTTVYWAVGGSLFRCAAAACAPETMASLGPGFSKGLALDGAWVFWGETDQRRLGGIRRFAR